MSEQKATADELLDQLLGKDTPPPTSIKDLVKRRDRGDQQRSQEKKANEESVIPMRVDTLRSDFSCPIDLGAQCGLDSPNEGDECDVCGYKVPPASLSDPDLSKAKRIKQKMLLEEEKRRRRSARIEWRRV